MVPDAAQQVATVGVNASHGLRRTCQTPRVVPPPSSRPATSSDVARVAGVSRTTVSHILNGHRPDRFPTRTRDRVLAAAEQLEYRPSRAGRSLVTGRSDTVLVLAPGTTWGKNLQDAVEALSAATAQLGTDVVVRFGGEEAAATTNSVLDRDPLAVVDLGVLDPGQRAHLEARGVLIVPGLPDSPTVDSPTDGVDREVAGLQVDALLRNPADGRRRIVVAALADARRDVYGPRRRLAVQEVCRERGLPAPSFVEVPLEVAGARDAVATEFRRGPVGVACYNDDVALAVLAAAREERLGVPDDVAVVGVDGTDVGQLWFPRLTTVAVDVRLLMELVAGRLLELLGSPGPEVVGRSCVRLLRGGTTP